MPGAVAAVAPKHSVVRLCLVRNRRELMPVSANNGSTLVAGFDRPHLAAKWSW
jgi:hypothetical protein